MLKKLTFSLISIAVIVSPLVVSGDTISELQARVQNLIAQIKAFQNQSSVQATQPSSPSSTVVITNSCPTLTRTLSRGSQGGDVVALQQFLIAQNTLSTGLNTGFFGPATERALQAWQSTHGIVSSGTPSSTGFGILGPRTRAFIMSGCSASPLSSIPISGGPIPDKNPSAPLSCLAASPPATSCSAGWQPVTDTNGCTQYYRCSIPLPTSTATSS